jgi:SAM-dependent methyltransferase
MSSYLDANRASWDERADIHVEDLTGAYGIERFLAGEDVLFPIEAAEIGDVAGLDLLHLQCHIGIDTLCLARRGARVTGLDFSPNALRHARELAGKAGLAARFVEGNIYDAPALIASAFDLVYSTWGTITWLPDIRRWGEVVSRMLKPGGRFYFADTHPGLAVLEEVGGRLEPTFNWRTPSSLPLEFKPTQTHTGDPRPLINVQNFEWLHPLSDIFAGLIDSGLQIRRFREHEALPSPMFPMMQQGPDRLYRLPAGVPRLPLSFSIEAVKAG